MTEDMDLDGLSSEDEGDNVQISEMPPATATASSRVMFALDDLSSSASDDAEEAFPMPESMLLVAGVPPAGARSRWAPPDTGEGGSVRAESSSADLGGEVAYSDDSFESENSSLDYPSAASRVVTFGGVDTRTYAIDEPVSPQTTSLAQGPRDSAADESVSSEDRGEHETASMNSGDLSFSLAEVDVRTAQSFSLGQMQNILQTNTSGVFNQREEPLDMKSSSEFDADQHQDVIHSELSDKAADSTDAASAMKVASAVLAKVEAERALAEATAETQAAQTNAERVQVELSDVQSQLARSQSDLLAAQDRARTYESAALREAETQEEARAASDMARWKTEQLFAAEERILELEHQLDGQKVDNLQSNGSSAVQQKIMHAFTDEVFKTASKFLTPSLCRHGTASFSYASQIVSDKVYSAPAEGRLADACEGIPGSPADDGDCLELQRIAAKCQELAALNQQLVAEHNEQVELLQTELARLRKQSEHVGIPETKPAPKSRKALVRTSVPVRGSGNEDTAYPCEYTSNFMFAQSLHSSPDISELCHVQTTESADPGASLPSAELEYDESALMVQFQQNTTALETKLATARHEQQALTEEKSELQQSLAAEIRARESLSDQLRLESAAAAVRESQSSKALAEANAAIRSLKIDIEALNRKLRSSTTVSETGPRTHNQATLDHSDERAAHRHGHGPMHKHMDSKDSCARNAEDCDEHGHDHPHTHGHGHSDEGAYQHEKTIEIDQKVIALETKLATARHEQQALIEEKSELQQSLAAEIRARESLSDQLRLESAAAAVRESQSSKALAEANAAIRSLKIDIEALNRKLRSSTTVSETGPRTHNQATLDHSDERAAHRHGHGPMHKHMDSKDSCARNAEDCDEHGHDHPHTHGHGHSDEGAYQHEKTIEIDQKVIALETKLATARHEQQALIEEKSELQQSLAAEIRARESLSDQLRLESAAAAVRESQSSKALAEANAAIESFRHQVTADMDGVELHRAAMSSPNSNKAKARSPVNNLDLASEKIAGKGAEGETSPTTTVLRLKELARANELEAEADILKQQLAQAQQTAMSANQKAKEEEVILNQRILSAEQSVADLRKSRDAKVAECESLVAALEKLQTEIDVATVSQSAQTQSETDLSTTDMLRQQITALQNENAQLVSSLAAVQKIRRDGGGQHEAHLGGVGGTWAGDSPTENRSIEVERLREFNDELVAQIAALQAASKRARAAERATIDELEAKLRNVATYPSHTSDSFAGFYASPTTGTLMQNDASSASYVSPHSTPPRSPAPRGLPISVPISPDLNRREHAWRGVFSSFQGGL